jgi:NADH-quinone oxidoreductase subunit J
MEQIAFFVLALLVVASALTTITHKNPVTCAVALAFNLVAIAGLYMLLDAQFLGLLQVIVYAGAIMVLILFVIMLLNLRAEEELSHPSGRVQRVIAPVASLIFSIVIGRAVFAAAPSSFPEKAPGFGTAAALGNELFTRFYYPFEAISLLLIVAMVGAVLLAKRKVE